MTQSTSGYDRLQPIMQRFGASGSARDFYWAVNNAYHTAESVHYDDQHADMFEGLEPVWARLIAAFPKTDPPLRVLDVGSGTGLVGQFLNRLCPNRVGTLVMLDPNRAMLEQSRKKSKTWHFPCEFRQGDVTDLAEQPLFDVITANSVLHHVVELSSFCSRLVAALAPGGCLLTAQDPRPEPDSDPVYGARVRAAGRQKLRDPRRYLNFIGRKLTAVRDGIRGATKEDPLAKATNEPLLRAGVIQAPMDMYSIWAVTDFHVRSFPGSIGQGIALADLRRWFSGLELVDHFTYQYIGVPWTRLTARQKKLERAWWDNRDMHGELFGTAWRNRAANGI